SGLDQGRQRFDRGIGVLVLALERPAFALRNDLLAELLLGQLVAPVAERPFGKLHDVALMDQGHGFQAVLEGVTHAAPHQLFGAGDRNGFDAHPRVEADLLLPSILAKKCVHKVDNKSRLLRPLAPLDTRVNVFRVFAEDDDVHALRIPDRRRHARNVFHRPPAGVEVQELPQGNVQAADAATHRRGQRTFDGNAELLDGVERSLRQPFTELLEGLFTRKHLVPHNPALAAKGFLDRRVEYPPRRLPDVAARAITLNVRNDRVVGNYELVVDKVNPRPVPWHGNAII